MNQPLDLSKLKIDRDDHRSSGGGRAFVWALVIFLLAGGLVGGAYLYQQQRSIVTVETMVVSLSADGDGGAAEGTTSVTANGYVVARTRASVSAKIAGRLASITVSEGSNVEIGQVMARLDNADSEAMVAQAEGNIATSRADLAEAEADQIQAERDAARLRELRSRSADLIAAQEVETAESRATASAARTRAAAARIQAAQAALNYAHANLDNTFIRAPFTGTVLRKEAEVGEIVAPSVGGGLTRGAVVTMADLTTLEVEVDVNEAYISRIERGHLARIALDAYPDTTFRGAVRQIVPTADRQRATVQVKVDILDHDKRILPEMGARVDFLEPAPPPVDSATAAAAQETPRVRVPSTAVFEQGGQTSVWLVREEKLVLRAVEAGPVSAGFREVRSGLTGGEMLVTGSVVDGKEGMRVKVGQP